VEGRACPPGVGEVAEGFGGKEVVARLIHQWSSRLKCAFVPINCAAIPDELMEGELFGYTKGAFSGAVRDYDGLVRRGRARRNQEPAVGLGHTSRPHLENRRLAVPLRREAQGRSCRDEPPHR